VGQTPGETRRLTLREASDRSGIPLDALRKRVYRGNIPAAKVDGAYTILETDLVAIVGANGHTPPVDRTLGETVGETVLGRGSDTGEAMSDGLALDYIASLKDEVAFLRRELETRTDELQRRDVLLREALQRVPQLAAGETARSQIPARSIPRVLVPYVKPQEGRRRTRRTGSRWYSRCGGDCSGGGDRGR
jgi:hypothetical protein